jgi:hypothetical protein
MLFLSLAATTTQERTLMEDFRLHTLQPLQLFTDKSIFEIYQSEKIDGLM